LIIKAGTYTLGSKTCNKTESTNTVEDKHHNMKREIDWAGQNNAQFSAVFLF